MGITNSQIIEDSAQADGRRRITEKHIDHLGRSYSFVYVGAYDVNAESILNNRVSVIEQKLIDNDTCQSIARFTTGENPLTMTYDYCTQKQAARKMILWAMAEKDVKFFLLLKPLIEYLKTNYTNAQLANWLDITEDELTRIYSRYNAILAIEATLNTDDEKVEVIDYG